MALVDRRERGRVPTRRARAQRALAAEPECGRNRGHLAQVRNARPLSRLGSTQPCADLAALSGHGPQRATDHRAARAHPHRSRAHERAHDPDATCAASSTSSSVPTSPARCSPAASFADVARPLGISRQAAHRRYRDLAAPPAAAAHAGARGTSRADPRARGGRPARLDLSIDSTHLLLAIAEQRGVDVDAARRSFAPPTINARGPERAAPRAARAAHARRGHPQARSPRPRRARGSRGPPPAGPARGRAAAACSRFQQLPDRAHVAEGRGLREARLAQRPHQPAALHAVRAPGVELRPLTASRSGLQSSLVEAAERVACRGGRPRSSAWGRRPRP